MHALQHHGGQLSRTGLVSGSVGLFLLGGLVGALATFLKVAAPSVEIANHTTLQWLRAESYARYRLGSYENARRALLAYAEHAESRALETESPQNEVLQGESALSYARLAVLAERKGDSAEAKKYFRRAQDVYGSRGESPSVEQIQQLVKNLDDHWDSDYKELSPQAAK
jgi:hypothetical protein